MDQKLKQIFYRDINQEITKKYIVDPIILKATLAQESSYGKNIDHDDRYISESGLMGLEKRTAMKQLKNLGYKFDYNKIEDVIRASAAYYKWIKSYHSKKLLRFKNQSSPLKLYTQYSSDLDAIYVNKLGIAPFLYHYFYFKNQL